MKPIVLAIANQKAGVSKTTTVNLGIGLAREARDCFGFFFANQKFVLDILNALGYNKSVMNTAKLCVIM